MYIYFIMLTDKQPNIGGTILVLSLKEMGFSRYFCHFNSSLEYQSPLGFGCCPRQFTLTLTWTDTFHHVPEASPTHPPPLILSVVGKNVIQKIGETSRLNAWVTAAPQDLANPATFEAHLSLTLSLITFNPAKEMKEVKIKVCYWDRARLWSNSAGWTFCGIDNGEIMATRHYSPAVGGLQVHIAMMPCGNSGISSQIWYEHHRLPHCDEQCNFFILFFLLFWHEGTPNTFYVRLQIWLDCEKSWIHPAGQAIHKETARRNCPHCTLDSSHTIRWQRRLIPVRTFWHGPAAPCWLDSCFSSDPP